MNKTARRNGENAALVEGDGEKNKPALHSRYEWVQKTAEELDPGGTTYGHGAVFPVNAFTIGFNYDLLNIGQTRLAGGGQFTFYHADERLDPLYGHNPMAFEIYLRLYPGRMK